MDIAGALYDLRLSWAHVQDAAGFYLRVSIWLYGRLGRPPGRSYALTLSVSFSTEIGTDETHDN
ncbi:hypothetical protein NT2_04_04230 [Caenibius tardaugens NBRC 16725]|uniref:Uncharacterized protein n=1 Tax=Caenibius tardaugens NBRC 16725 TaxID=1219035 RepID=U2YKD5_9SPHN|nr:hypothetical protein NT2_04_04230 [Caenibius tardaugens NBRC 16725]